MTGGPVVRETTLLDEHQFHARLTAGFSRCIVHAGKARFALDLGMTTRALEKVMAGSTPRPHSIFNIHCQHPTVLDELAAGYGFRIVPDHAVCSTDEIAGLVLLRAATKCVEAEADGRKDHRELLGMERELREAASFIAGMLARIDQIKGTGGG